MLRITESSSDGCHWTIKLEEHFRRAWVGEVVNACRHDGADRGLVQLDLSTVKFVDEAGVEALRELQRQGVSIGPCSDFVAELLRK